MVQEPKVKTATAFSPCSITGFFRIYDNDPNPLLLGSTGASVALGLGVRTSLTVKKARKSQVLATLNGQTLPRTSLSVRVATEYVHMHGSPCQINVVHKSQLPVGCGYGTSGAGALGLSLALNEAMGSPFETLEAAQLAHIAEVECKTGLGTVSSIFSGGFTLRTLAGAPGIGRVNRLQMPSSLRIMTASYGPISTKRVLGNRTLTSRINGCGKNSIRRFNQTPTYAGFMHISRMFCDCLGLMTDRLSRLIHRLDSAGLRSSMAMLGESAFTIAGHDEISLLTAFVRKEGLTPRVTSVARTGAHLL